MKKILFACTENKKRSQVAEAIFNHLVKNVKAESAGTIPAEKADPIIQKALKERGISYISQTPKKITDEMLESADLIISFGCLPPSNFPEEKFEEWNVFDPQKPEEYSKLVDELFQKVQDMKKRYELS